ncbi:hypothetical protein BHM03_00012621 [Ensete ventricosum]|nr:hypothetical protein BHM03_00012621 [Ensete ventricosum]
MKALVISIWRLSTIEGEVRLQVPMSPMEGLDYTKVVERGEEAMTSSVELSYPKSKVSVKKEVDTEECHSAVEADLPIVKEGMRMQGNG